LVLVKSEVGGGKLSTPPIGYGKRLEASQPIIKLSLKLYTLTRDACGVRLRKLDGWQWEG
jgi:hypothetical protein